MNCAYFKPSGSAALYSSQNGSSVTLRAASLGGSPSHSGTGRIAPASANGRNQQSRERIIVKLLTRRPRGTSLLGRPRHSAAVLELICSVRPIARWLWRSVCSRRTSRTFRMDNLSAANLSSGLSPRMKVGSARVWVVQRRPLDLAPGQLEPKRLVDIAETAGQLFRNGWSDCTETTGQLQPTGGWIEPKYATPGVVRCPGIDELGVAR